MIVEGLTADQWILATDSRLMGLSHHICDCLTKLLFFGSSILPGFKYAYLRIQTSNFRVERIVRRIRRGARWTVIIARHHEIIQILEQKEYEFAVILTDLLHETVRVRRRV